MEVMIILEVKKIWASRKYIFGKTAGGGEGQFVLHPVFSGLVMRYFEAMKINYGLHNTVLDNLDNFGNSE